MRPAPLLRLAVVATIVGCKAVERPPSAVPITTKVLLRYHPPAGASYAYVLDQTSRIAPDTFTTDTGGRTRCIWSCARRSTPRPPTACW